MRFEVPQFINIEDKIFGPFSVKQALYLVGGGGIIFLIFKISIIPNFIAFILALPIAAFSLALVFYRPYGRPFIQLVEAYLIYAFTQKFYLWRKKEVNQKISLTERKQAPFPEEGAREQKQKLSDLAWSLDILDIEE